MHKKTLFQSSNLILLLLIVFFAVSTGGCGSNGGSLGGGSSGNNPTNNNEGTKEGIANQTQTILQVNSGMDADGNGLPDLLDFTGVEQVHLNNNTVSNVFTASSLSSAAEAQAQVPAMFWLKELKSRNNADVVSVYLEAGKSYTVEFSKNLTEALEDVLPEIEIFDPDNANLPDSQAERLDVSIAVYPKEHPSIICYTFKPTVTGNYAIKIYDAEPSTINLEDITTAEETYEVDTESVIFVYEEKFNENGEPGYYTRFQVADPTDGTRLSDVISVRDIIQLRKEILALYDDYIGTVYGWDAPDDKTGKGATEYDIDNDKGVYYDYYMRLLQEGLGFIAVNDNYTGDEENGEENTISAAAANDPYAIDLKLPPLTGTRSEIPAKISGIPYDNSYVLGMGFSAITNLSPVGGISALDDFENEVTERVKNNPLPVITDYTASFISTREEADTLSKATTGISLAKDALGASYTSTSSNNYKFGLTATNYVIHFEVSETKYRGVSDKRIEEMLKNTLISSPKNKHYPQNKVVYPADDDEETEETSVKTSAGNINAAEDDKSMFDFMLSLEPDFFRTQFGDYYVSSFQYGACFDAIISIKTTDSTQIQNIKRGFNLAFGGADSSDISADLKIGKELQKTLAENQAEINVKIITQGMGLKPINIPKTSADIFTSRDYVASKDYSQIDDVFTKLAEFRNELAKAATDRTQFVPLRVRLKRWRSLPSIGYNFIQKGDIGTIPIPPETAKNIRAFNTGLLNLRTHRNFVMGLGESIAPAKNLEQQFARILSYPENGGNSFYSDDNMLKTVLDAANQLDERFIALSDRYVFYQKLVAAQKAEKKTYEQLDKQVKGSDGDEHHEYVRKMPFGAEKGGHSGYTSFAASPNYVNKDIRAGKTISRSYVKNADFAYRYEWFSDQSKMSSESKDYNKDGPARLTAELDNGTTKNAIFCYVAVDASATSHHLDQARDVLNSPAVGKNDVKFYFRGGGTRDVNWTITGQTMELTPENYPFDGLE